MVNGGGGGVMLFVLLFHVEFMWRGTDWRGAVVRFDAVPSRPCARRSLPAALICAFQQHHHPPPPHDHLPLLRALRKFLERVLAGLC
jgi:hypothetical protein